LVDPRRGCAGTVVLDAEEWVTMDKWAPLHVPWVR
jgi:hypothetical protein